MSIEWIKQRDDRTGREVWRITNGPGPSQFVYPLMQGFTADERHVVLSSRRDRAHRLSAGRTIT